ncbi:bifunctional 3,4-dihydroxy-2-butanone-4-phosphate synthase/GTP cyclohydrolase II [bacterium]|nr:bifunctional 3,4-dihydroxy-2-butanone-4-phosphate synthase/GTP cyclohydrolase II [bacterium]
MGRISVEQAIEDIRQGRFVIVVDDEQRENEGDFILAACHITPEKINFLLKHARGMICVPMTRSRQAHLELFPMVARNTEHQGTNFTVTVDSNEVSTGISAYDRYLTIRALANDRTRPEDLLRPGHINPLIARDGGVLVRAGHTEAATDLCRLAGVPPVGVICEILNEDGTMARVPDLEQVATNLGVGIITIEDLIAYRKTHEKLVRRVVSARIPNPFGLWDVHVYENLMNGDEHQVFVLGDPAAQDSALIRVHSKCFTGDTFLSQRCDCGPQLMAAMERISAEGHGVIIYMDQEGRGIGLRAKLAAYNLQDKGQDTVQANESLGFKPDLREYGIGAQILADLGLHKIRIMTNNPTKIVGISGFGLEVVGREPLVVGLHAQNERYMRTKAIKMGHLLPVSEGE